MLPASSKPNAFTSILINIIIPVLILEHCSSGSSNPLQPLEGQKIWELGPIWGMTVALLFPISYGVLSLITRRKVELMSGIGLAGVLLTGIISYSVISAQGSISPHTPWLFATKEALIPFVLAMAVLASIKSESPLLNTFLFNPDVFNIPLIECKIQENKSQNIYEQLLKRCNYMIAGALCLSSIANFALAFYLLSPVLSLAKNEQQLAYNLAVGSITWWGFLIIGIPIVLVFAFVLFHLLAHLEKLCGLPRQELLQRKGG